MYINSLACVRVKGGESDTEVYHVPLALQCIYECSDVGAENGDGEEWSEISGGGKRVETPWPLVCR